MLISHHTFPRSACPQEDRIAGREEAASNLSLFLPVYDVGFEPAAVVAAIPWGWRSQQFVQFLPSPTSQLRARRVSDKSDKYTHTHSFGQAGGRAGEEADTVRRRRRRRVVAKQCKSALTKCGVRPLNVPRDSCLTRLFERQRI